MNVEHGREKLGVNEQLSYGVTVIYPSVSYLKFWVCQATSPTFWKCREFTILGEELVFV